MIHSYLDGASNTPLSPEVLQAMLPYMSEDFVGNSMATHEFGTDANIAIERARESIALDLHVRPDEIFFTSGATEGNNWVIKSAAFRALLLNKSPRKTIICSKTEHASVFNCCKQVEDWGMNVVFVEPDRRGSVQFDAIQPYLSGPSSVADDIALICLMAVNNEIGVDNGVGEITRAAAMLGIPVLVDCTQALSCGGINVEIGDLYPDATFMTFSAHKIYGPLGCGCLVARDSDVLEPLIIGGAQEKGLRGGTMNTPGIIGMASAVHIAHAVDCTPQFMSLFKYLTREAQTKVPEMSVNCWPDHMNIVSLNFARVLPPNIDQLASMLASRGIAVSAGSACDATHNETEGDFNGSHVLTALGLTERDIRCTIRVSFTKYTTTSDIDELLQAIKEICEWSQM